jgi:RND family efflux transporter MFP subunit
MSRQHNVLNEVGEHETSQHRQAVRDAHGYAKLLGVSGLLMALALPIGVYPRIMRSAELDEAHQKTVTQLPEVSVTKPEQAPISRKISLPGNIEAILETGIYARANGYIQNRVADIGDRVAEGQLLAEIETPEIDESAKEAKAMVLTNIAAKAQAEASLNKTRADLVTAEADLAQAKANLIQLQSNEKFAATSTERWNVLVRQGAVSTQDADQKDTNYKTSQAATLAGEERIRSAESQVVAAKALIKAQLATIAASDANIEAAKAREGVTTSQQKFQKVLAPFAGVITERNIDQGTLISSGSDSSKTTLYRLARIDTVRVFVDVPQYAATGIHVGLPVTVTLKEFPGKTFSGEVKRTSVALDATARTLRTEIHIPNNQMILAPGMYADVSFTVPSPTKGFVIPATALISRGEGPQVALLNNDIIRLQSIQLGDDLGKEVEVVSGLKGNEEMVANPSDYLHDGVKVRLAAQ